LLPFSSAVCVGIAAQFHFANLALVPSFLIVIWLMVPDRRKLASLFFFMRPDCNLSTVPPGSFS
jgi:hypothetical protein